MADKKIIAVVGATGAQGGGLCDPHNDADEMGNMLQVYRVFEKEVTGARDTTQSRRLYPGLMTFDQFLAKYKDRIPR